MGNEVRPEELPENPSAHDHRGDPEKNKLHLQYGLLAGLVLIALFVIYYVLGWSFDRDFKSWIPSVIFMLLVIVAQFKHLKEVEHNISFGNLFAKGFKTAAVATCIYVVFMILFIWLEPAYKDRMMEISRQGMVEKGMGAEQVKAAMAMVKKFFMVSAIAGSVIGELVLGLIASLVGAAVAPKNKKPELQPLS